MRTLLHLVVGAKAGLILLWRARRAGRSFAEQLEHERHEDQRRAKGLR